MAASSGIGPSSRRQLEQEPVGLADLAAGRDAEQPHDLVAVEVGPDRVELLLPRRAARSAPRGRRRCAAAARPCGGCGSCSRRGSGCAAARAGRRRRARSGVRRSRSTRRGRSRGSAGAARPACETASISALEKRSACIRLRVIFAPTTSWWWKVTVPSSRNLRVARLADVVHQRREPDTRSGAAAGQPVLEVDRLLEHRERVLVDVLVPVVLVALERAGSAARAARSAASPVSTSSVRPRRGCGAVISFTSSSRTRSAEMMSIRSRHAGHRRDHLGRDLEAELRGEPGRAHHPQRVVGEASPPGCPACAAARWARSTTPPYGSSTIRSGSATAIALTVKSRRPRSPVEGVAEVDGRLAGGRVVRLGPVGRDLDLPVAGARSRWSRSRGRRPRSRPPTPRAAARSRRGGPRWSRSRSATAGRASRRAPDRRPAPARGRRRRTARRGRRARARAGPARSPHCAGAPPRSAGRTRVRTRGSTLGRGGGRRVSGRTAARSNLYACSAGCRSVLPWRRWRSRCCWPDRRTPTRAVRRARTRRRRPSCARSRQAAPARKQAVSRRAKRARAETDAPLAVTIDQLTPSTIPEKGMVRVSGTITNNDTVTWSTINVYAFISDEPLTTPDQLERGSGHARGRRGRRPDHRRAAQGHHRGAGAGRPRDVQPEHPAPAAPRRHPRASTGSACTRSVRGRTAGTWRPTAAPAPSSRWSPRPGPARS